MDRCVALLLLALISCAAMSTARELPAAGRGLLAEGDSGDSPTACCSCKCVVRRQQQQQNSCGGKPCLGAIGPTYSKKNICINGFAKTCDDVCLVDHGSYTSYKDC